MKRILPVFLLSLLRSRPPSMPGKIRFGPCLPHSQAPSGVNTAIVPVPRLDWVVRVKTNNGKASMNAAGIRLVSDADWDHRWLQGAGKQIWAERYAKLGAFDFGISGDHTEHVLWRLSRGQTDGLHPKLIAIMIGTNDMDTNGPEPIAEGVKAIINDYRTRCPDATILLQAIFPRGHLATDPARAKIRETNKILAGLGGWGKSRLPRLWRRVS